MIKLSRIGAQPNEFTRVSNASNDKRGAESNGQHVADRISSDDPPWHTTCRKIIKVLRSPFSAVPLFNAQLRIRGRARSPLSVRLVGRIHLSAHGDVEFGNGVALVGNVVPIEFVSYEGARISIGDHTFINYGASITAYKQVTIGRHCLLGHHVIIVDKSAHSGERRELARPAAPVIIEDQVWIGSHAIILPGVRIGRHAAIGAGSVVTKDVPANCLAVGNPARVVRQL
jgi:acetyltransferase-like isoleucine patch superfamily enzyme